MAQYQTLLKQFEQVQSHFRQRDRQHLFVDEGFEATVKDYDIAQDTRTYRPCQTGLRFHQDHPLNFRLAMGPYGSGKTTFNMWEHVFAACRMPPCKDGIRRYKLLITRNTTPELLTSTYPSWMHWFGSLGNLHTVRNPILQATHTFHDGKGLVELQVIFLAFDRPDSLRKLKSTEFTSAYLNELAELPEALLSHVNGRIGRYPSSEMCPDDFHYFVTADTNPPDTDHWLYHLMEENKPQGTHLYKQPPGLIKDEHGIWQTNEHADNYAHLPSHYYINQARGANEEYIKVFCCGEYGILRHGQPVYPNYNDDVHSVINLDIDKDHPIYLGFDFGVVTPAVVIAQYIHGQLRVIKEFCGDHDP